MTLPAHTVQELGERSFIRQLRTFGVPVRIGPFNALVQATVPHVQEALFQLYSDHRVLPDADVFSFRARVSEQWKLRRPLRKYVRFTVDGHRPHEDLPAEQALAVLEWGINLVIALRSHAYLMLHAAVLERSGRALLMPAAPGFGKTTLCAALSHQGWRLLSDEFGLLRPDTRELLPVPRPMALKNESISVIRSLLPDAVIGPDVPNTRKGTVAHLKPPRDAVRRQAESAGAGWIVFPRWERGAEFSLERLSSAESFMSLAMNAFNYELLGESAFRTVSGLLHGAECFTLVYSDLETAVARLTAMADAGTD